ncbi:unnamed protein product [Effrenium voratum]|nr:unnamed protein product [Effrenium voratum]
MDDQLCLWKLLMCGFGAVLMLQVVAMDMAGAMLTVLLLAFGWIMLRDGMVEMAKYALIYAVLCGLNFFFEILPLFSELSGRVTRRAEFVAPSISARAPARGASVGGCFNLARSAGPNMDRAEFQGQ